MQMRRYLKAGLAVAVAAGLTITSPPPAGAFGENDLVVGLTADDEIALFAGAGVGVQIEGNAAITGLETGDNVVGIDFRPATGDLYGLGQLGFIYTIDIETGAAIAVSETPVTPLPVGDIGFDFNPVADRIRIVTSTDQDLRVNPDTGAAIVDGPIAYAVGDANEGENPNIVGSGYTNSTDGKTTTSLFNVDADLDVLTLQNPPNNGTQVTVGELGVDIGTTVGLDIGRYNAASMVTTDGTTSTLYDVNLTTGAATEVGDMVEQVDDIAIAPDVPLGSGYALAALDGGVFNYGNSSFEGSAGSLRLNAPVIDIANHTAFGYWMVATDGGVFNYGAADFFGSAGSIDLNAAMVGIASTPTDKGYWLVAADGGVFAYGDAKFFGSAGSLDLNSPVVSIMSTPSGNGYWLVAADGGVFAYGDAKFSGSAGSLDLNAEVVSGAPTASGNGYWLFAEDGGVFAYGDAQFRGSAGSIDLAAPVVDGAAAEDGSGYWLAAADGGVFAYGSPFFGSAGGEDLNSPVIAIAGV